ncbi:MAG TPA: sortase [Bacteroidetes bacterium]|nr:sortase [Bacteroidota bacterium]
MNPLKNTSEVNENGNVPNNLPHDNPINNDSDDKNLQIKISKQTLKTTLKILIIVLIITISAPRIINNISSTFQIIEGGAEKFPQTFPSLTMTGSTIGSFVYNQFKDFGNFMTNNLANMAELLYSRKLNPNEEVITGSQETIKEKTNPIRIIIEKIGVDSTILNPEKTDTETLNNSLKYGVVRYPKSGILGEKDNIYLFGHSTSIKIVRNQAYKSLNNLNKLEKGDNIKLQSENNEYLYKVTSVTMKKNSEAIVSFNTGKRTLTISTCNTLGAKEDRYIVTADFITSYPILNTTNTNEEEIVAEIIPETPATEVNPVVPLTPGEETDITIPIIGGNTLPPSNPYGKPDLDAKITKVGIIDPQTNNFIATSTLTTKDKIAVKFVISNLGTKTAEGWTFNMVLPTNPLYIFHSKTQNNLKPGERIEYAIAFDKPKESDDAIIIVNVDPTRTIFELNENNNIVKKIVKIER